MFAFAEETGIIQQAPKLKRVKNEARPRAGSTEKPLYTLDDLNRLLKKATLQLKAMLALGLNCGFGPRDIRDLRWDHINAERVALPRSKAGICQTYLLWPEARALQDEVRQRRAELAVRRVGKKVQSRDNGHVFMTRFWRHWSKDAVAEH